MGTNEKVLTVGEVATVLQCSITTVYSLVERGELRSFRLGGKRGQYRFRQSALNDYIEKKEELDGKEWEKYRRAKGQH